MTALDLVLKLSGARLPVRSAVDGDFSVSDLNGLARGATSLRATPGLAAVEAALEHRLWLLPAPTGEAVLAAAGEQAPVQPPTSADEELLQAFETSAAVKPPVAEGVQQLTSAVGHAWLLIGQRWVSASSVSADLRYFNTACKIFGAVRARLGAADAADWGGPAFARTLAEVAADICDVSDDIVNGTLSQPRRELAIARDTPPASGGATDEPVRIVLLAAAGSSGALRLLRAADHRALPIAALCWYAPASTGTDTARHSHYAAAWYPHSTDRTVAAPDDFKPRTGMDPPARAWNEVVVQLREHQPDLLLLAGMPIVPDEVLKLARLGVINAHNGALPAYRGMDAVGWAILNRDPVVCTVHHAVANVDAGPVIATHTLEPGPAGTLHARVKAAQLRLLLDVAAYTHHSGRLPPSQPQPAHNGRLYYRMHPHLKRLLDTRIAAENNDSLFLGSRS